MENNHPYFDPDSQISYREEDKLFVMNSEDIADHHFPTQQYLVEGFLQQGLCILSGAPKVGKSWLVLHLCLQVAKGAPFLNMDVRQSDVLYITLEDTARRIHNRINTLTPDSSRHLYITNECAPLGSRFFWQIKEFIREHPKTRLIVIDTFQMLRGDVKDPSYAGDYSDLSALKACADHFSVTILLVHHNRKMPDGDYTNVISGTTGIAGCCDTIMVLQKEKRRSRDAILSCTGRDIEDRELTLELDRNTCTWKVKSDSYEKPDDKLPQELVDLYRFMKQQLHFYGTNKDFCDLYCAHTGADILPNRLKRQMNLHTTELELCGVIYRSERVNNARMLTVEYRKDYDMSYGMYDKKR